MLVSNFELLVKRIAPLVPVGPDPVAAPVNAPFRRTVTGYFLAITNLEESRSIRFSVEFVASRGAPADDEARTLTAGNTEVTYDVTGGDADGQAFRGPLTIVETSENFVRARTKTFRLEPLQTGSVKLLPELVDSGILGEEQPNLEIRGYARILGRPGKRLRPGKFFGFRRNPQILLTPETRGTVLDNRYDPTASTPPEGDLDFDSLAYSLPLASGKAENTLPGISLF